MAGELLVVRYTSVSADEWHDGVKGTAGTALAAGLMAASICLLTAFLAGGSFGRVLTIVALFLPFLLMQDVWRYAFFAAGRGSAAFVNDAVWAVALFAGFAYLRHLGATSVALFTLAWAGAGCLAAIVGVFQVKLLPRSPRAAVSWLRRHRDLAPRFVAEFAVGTGVSNLTLFAIGGIAGLGELGRLRAGEIALGPLNVLFAGAGLVATAEGVRLLQESPARLMYGCRWLSLAMAIGVLSWGATLLSLPTAVGEFALKANWEAARSLLPPLLVYLTGYGSSFGALVGLRSLAAARRSLRTKCIDGLFTLLCGLGGAHLAGAQGAAWGYAATGCVRSINAWWQFSHALREYQTGPERRNVRTATIAARS